MHFMATSDRWIPPRRLKDQKKDNPLISTFHPSGPSSQ